MALQIFTFLRVENYDRVLFSLASHGLNASHPLYGITFGPSSWVTVSGTLLLLHSHHTHLLPRSANAGCMCIHLTRMSKNGATCGSLGGRSFWIASSNLGPKDSSKFNMSTRHRIIILARDHCPTSASRWWLWVLSLVHSNVPLRASTEDRRFRTQLRLA
jgi:hypothetical protein